MVCRDSHLLFHFLKTQAQETIAAYFKDSKDGSFLTHSNAAAKPLTPSGNSAAINIFKLPVSEQLKHLTPSERLFTFATRIDVSSLEITVDWEFFLFMEMRGKEKWSTNRMSSHKYMEAANQFNAKLAERARSKNCTFTAKNPRAIVDKLAEVERQVLNRIATGNYKCKWIYLDRTCT